MNNMDFEEVYITDLINYPFGDSKQSIFCYFPETNFAMVSVKNEWRSLQRRTLFIPIKVEKNADPTLPYSIHLYCVCGCCIITPYRDFWDSTKIKMIKFKNPVINYKAGDLLKIYGSNHPAIQEWPITTNSEYTDILNEPRLKKNDLVCILELEDRKTKVLTSNGIVGWIPSMLLKPLHEKNESGI